MKRVDKSEKWVTRPRGGGVKKSLVKICFGIRFGVPKLDLEKEMTKEENLQTISNYKEHFDIPDHVLLVKCLSDFNRHPELNESLPRTEPPAAMENFLGPQHSDRGGGNRGS